MKIKNVGEVIEQLKPLLEKYLKDCKLKFREPLFQCPNYKEHNNEDAIPSCGFLPDTNKEKWHCFTCGCVGDIFQAVSLLEGKNIQGLGFYKTVQYLADKYAIKYEYEEPTEEEKRFDLVQTFLFKITDSAHKYLITNKPKSAMDYLERRKWTKGIKLFEFGYLPKSDRTKKFFIDAYRKHPELKSMISMSDEQIVNRLIYPIKSKHGTILGIGHRAIDENDTRHKYLKHYIKTINKTGVVYNLRGVDSKVYLVEGASSVFTLYENGIENAISYLGAENFSEHSYNNLARNKVEKLVLCCDGDEAGDKSLEKIISIVQTKPDIKVYVKKLPLNKDPDDIIQEQGIEAFKNMEEMSLFKYQINRLKEDDDDNIKKSVYSLIISTNDSILRERMIQFFTKELKTQKTALLDELKKYEHLHSLDSDIKVSEVMEEKESLKAEIDKFEERCWRTDKILGVSTGFPILDDRLDGVQDGLHEVGGVWNVGKSAFLLTVALNMLKDENNQVLYFSIDDPIQTKTIPRAMANLSSIPINVAANPYWKIQKNETLQEAEKIELSERREKALKLLDNMVTRFSLKDASHGYQVDFVEKMIKIRKLIQPDKRLIVFIDFLHMLSLGKSTSDSVELLTRVTQQLKHFAGLYQVPIITTVEGTKEIGSTVMKDRHIKGSVSLQYAADTIMLLNSSFFEDPKSNMYFRDEEGEARPIVAVTLGKNKSSGFKGTVYFKFYPEQSRFEECDFDEQQKYRKGY
jgi:DNA primase catalytic core